MTEPRTPEQLRQEIDYLLTSDYGPVQAQISHRAGRVRALVWALTGEDVGYDCLRPHRIPELCRLAAIRCDPMPDGRFWVAADHSDPPAPSV